MTGAVEARMAMQPAGQYDDRILEESLALGLRLVGQVESFALQFSNLGSIDLPPVMGSANDQAHLRAAAPLYLASELESALLLPAVEMMAGLFGSGALRMDLGSGAARLNEFWRGRRDRLTAAERQSFFSQLFGQGFAPSGPGVGFQFDLHMLNLCETLSQLEPNPGLPSYPGTFQATRVRIAGGELAEYLLQRSSGMVGFAARDILNTIQRGLDILKEPMVQRSVGANSVWAAVQAIGRRYLNARADIGAHVRRGRAGMVVLAWLAEALPLLNRAAGDPAPAGDPAIAASVQWLQSSYAISEDVAQSAGQGA